MVVDDATVAVDTCRRTGNVANPRQHHRDRTRGNDRVHEVVGRQRDAFERETGRVVERGQIARIVKEAAREEHSETPPADGIREARREQPGPQRRPVIAGRQQAAAHGQDVRAEPRMPHDLGSAGFPQHTGKNLAALAGDFGGRRPRAVTLPEVGGFEALERRERRCLGVAGEAPGTDRGAQQVYRPRQLRHYTFDDDAVELAQDQPFGPAGRPGDGTDPFLRETPLPDVAICPRPCPEAERPFFTRQAATLSRAKRFIVQSGSGD